MSLVAYLRLDKFRRYGTDWVCTLAIVTYFFAVAEHAKPFNRQFKLDDHTIQHPFAVQERVTGHACLIMAAVVPFVVMAVVSFSKHRSHTHNAWHLLQVSLLATYLTVSVSGTITDILKNWVGRPRPDFLARCGPEKGTSTSEFVDISVCTAPLGQGILADGMRLTPSGHLSISFSAFLFLSMWLYGQFRLGHHGHLQPIYMYLLAASPLLLASYVALSRVQDYRHHFVDILLGGTLGCIIAVAFYRKYFNAVTMPNSHEIKGEEEHSTLPL